MFENKLKMCAIYTPKWIIENQLIYLFCFSPPRVSLRTAKSQKQKIVKGRIQFEKLVPARIWVSMTHKKFQSCWARGPKKVQPLPHIHHCSKRRPSRLFPYNKVINQIKKLLWQQKKPHGAPREFTCTNTFLVPTPMPHHWKQYIVPHNGNGYIVIIHLPFPEPALTPHGDVREPAPSRRRNSMNSMLLCLAENATGPPHLVLTRPPVS